MCRTVLCSCSSSSKSLRAADLHLTAQETAELDAASDPGPPDYPYGEMGAEQRSRSLAGGR
jgi:aryl-alcohol dehydrogenase (NADP+)